jgi:hypothetical protein
MRVSRIRPWLPAVRFRRPLAASGSTAPAQIILLISVADPDPGSDAFLAIGSGMGKKSGSGSGMNKPDHISESLETIFWVKIRTQILLMRIRDPVCKKFGSGKNIPDSQQWY